MATVANKGLSRHSRLLGALLLHLLTYLSQRLTRRTPITIKA